MLVKILITEETENYKLTRESQGFKGGSVGGSVGGSRMYKQVK